MMIFEYYVDEFNPCWVVFSMKVRGNSELIICLLKLFSVICMLLRSSVLQFICLTGHLLSDKTRACNIQKNVF